MIRCLLLLLGLVCTACSSRPLPATATFMPPIQYLALGDSYTIGESVEAAERWPNQLAARLETSPEFAGRRVDVSLIARTGWTTQELWEGIQARQLAPPYDLVSLLIGVNNQYRGQDLNEYREQFAFLLAQAISYAGGDPQRVIVLSIPDWGVTPFAVGRDQAAIAQAIDAFNAVNRTETERAGAQYIDITPISRAAAGDPGLIASDGLHPAGRMYQAWVEQVLPIATKMLRATK